MNRAMVLLIGVVGIAVYAVLQLLLHVHRKRIKEGDVVGVALTPDLIVNRTVLKVTKGLVWVQGKRKGSHRWVPIEKTFLPDSFSPVDTEVE